MNGLLEIAPAAAVAESVADSCSLDNYLAQPDNTMDARIAAAREKLGTDVVLLGHHYQRDEVIRFADFTGDSYKLSKVAAETDAKYMLFCGVHFMAETADVLGRPWQQVILPDLNAGCSMADMAEIGQVEDCWDSLERAGITDEASGGLIPLTYMNSAAAIKAFCGERGGLVCTSSNARGAFEWAFARAGKILFLPDQHLGRNTAFAMGIPLSEMVVWDPYQINGGVSPDRLKAAKVILWKGHCSVHQRFLPEHVDRVRREEPGMQVIVHPECRWEVCQKADDVGSTEHIIQAIERAPEGSSFAVGTEIHLVNRLAKRFAPLGKRVITLDDSGCLCTTMYRISPQHLAWALENLVEGRVVNRIKVDDDVKQWAHVALDRMLEIRI
ncbi:quinolinate synthase NadA [Tunturiibacter empetritectus]|uniref:Quinolinate synthase n=1 Tax=Tunturiibacter lichenicola TaxID=2051959 RepID=A0A7W8J545_9BACT|nr:quinolinate synthase NadA [Edaphobacter lichenicola]MBB5342818.1 quinolinate synthase [Edaphobacter lichenicola]